MAILPSSVSKIDSMDYKKDSFFGLFILIIVIIFLIIYFFGGLKEKINFSGQELTIISDIARNNEIVSLSNLKLDSSFLQTDHFKKMRVFGALPIKTESLGRQNPFISY